MLKESPGEAVETRVFHNQAKYVEQEKPSLNPAAALDVDEYDSGE